MRAIKIDPETRTIEEIETDGSLKSMMAILSDGPCMVRLGRHDVLWVGDEGFLKPGLAVFRLLGYDNPLAGTGLVLGLDEIGDNQPTVIALDSIKEAVVWTDDESTGQLGPQTERVDGGVHYITTGKPILRKRRET